MILNLMSLKWYLTQKLKKTALCEQNMSKLTVRFEDGPIFYFLGKNHNGSHLAVCARLHKPVMLNGAETHGERKEERAEANAVAFGLVPFPRGALRRKQTRREEGRKEGKGCK